MDEFQSDEPHRPRPLRTSHYLRHLSSVISHSTLSPASLQKLFPLALSVSLVRFRRELIDTGNTLAGGGFSRLFAPRSPLTGGEYVVHMILLSKMGRRV
jgi:hypothetical protein